MGFAPVGVDKTVRIREGTVVNVSDGVPYKVFYDQTLFNGDGFPLVTDVILVAFVSTSEHNYLYERFLGGGGVFLGVDGENWLCLALRRLVRLAEPSINHILPPVNSLLLSI